MKRNLNYFYKSFDIEENGFGDKRLFENFNPYGYNFDSVKKRTIDREKKCIRSLNHHNGTKGKNR